MRARGFSLLELLVAAAVSTIVVAAGVALLLGMQRSFESGKGERAMQESARVAMAEVTGTLLTAGYGLEPTFAFDFGQANTIMDRVPIGTQVKFGGYQCTSGLVTCRDSATSPDELVFYSRDPSFQRNVTAVGITGNTITLNDAAQTLGLQSGQVLQVMCYGNASQWLWAYVTVANVDRSNPAAPVVTLTAPGAAPDFPAQNALLTQPCFAAAGTGGLVRAFKIDRYRYYIAAVNQSGAPQPWETAGTRPYLMLDQGLRGANGNVIVTPIAPDVEDMQVAYLFPLAAGAQLVGATPGTQMTNDSSDTTGIDLSPAAGIPAFSTPSLDPIRTTHHPANVRAVRVAFTLRSERNDPQVVDATVPAALNRPAIPGEAGYRRMVVETTTYTHNLETRLPVFPTYDPSFTSGSCTGTAGNCGGG